MYGPRVMGGCVAVVGGLEASGYIYMKEKDGARLRATRILRTRPTALTGVVWQ